MNPSASYRWVVLFVCTYLLVCYAFVLQSIPPILPQLIDGFSISYSQAGALMGSYALPAIFLSIPVGFLIDRLGVKKIATVSLALFAVGACITAWGATYTSLISGRTVAGIGAAALLVFAPRILAEWFEGKEFGLAVGVLNTSFPLGMMVALMSLGILAEHHGWRYVLVVSAAVSLSACLLFVVLHRDRVVAVAPRGERRADGLVVYVREAGWLIWMLAAVFMIYGAGYQQYFTFATDFYISRGYGVETSGLYASAPSWSGLLVAPVAGALMDKYGHAWRVVLIGSLGTAVMLASLPFGVSHAFLLAFLTGACGAAVVVAVYALPLAIMPGHRLGFGYGLLNTALALGMFWGPIGLGMLRDLTGRNDSLFYGMAGLMVLTILPVWCVRAHAISCPRSRSVA